MRRQCRESNGSAAGGKFDTAGRFALPAAESGIYAAKKVIQKAIQKYSTVRYSTEQHTQLYNHLPNMFYTCNTLVRHCTS